MPKCLKSGCEEIAASHGFCEKHGYIADQLRHDLSEDIPTDCQMELPIYQQTIHGVITLYCEDCKPQGTSQRGTLVVSGWDHFCDGCGHDFRDIAEKKEKHHRAEWHPYASGNNQSPLPSP